MATHKAAGASSPGVTWRFTSHFRRGAYGWNRTKLACQRMDEARREIAAVARTDAVAAADGAVKLSERLVPAIEHVDSSSDRSW